MALNEEQIRLLIQAKDEATQTIKNVEKSLGGMNASTSQSSISMKGLANSFSEMVARGNVVEVALNAIGIAAVGMAAKVAFAMAQEEASNIAQEAAFKNMAAQARLSSDEIVAAMEKASKGTVSHDQLIATASRAMSTGLALDADKMERLMSLANEKAAASGKSTADTFDTITTAISYQAPRMLRGVQITISAAEAYKTFAASIGKSTDELTDEEKQMAFFNAVMNKASTSADGLAGSAGNMRDNFERLKASTENASSAIGGALVPALSGIAGNMASLIEWWTKGITALEQFVSISAATIPGLTAYADTLIKTGNAEQAAIAAHEAGVKAFTDTANAFGLLTSSTDATTKAEKDNADQIQRLGDIYKKAILSGADALRQYEAQAAQTEKSFGKSVNALIESWNDSLKKASASRQDTEATTVENLTRLNRDYFESVASAQLQFSRRIEEMDYNRNKQYASLADERLSIEKDYQASVNQLSRDTVDKEMNAKTYSEVLRIRKDAEERRKELETGRRDRMSDLDKRKAEIDEQYNHTKQLADRDHAENLQRMQTQHDRSVADIEDQKQKKLAAIEEQLEKERLAINKRQVEEYNAYIESKNNAATAFNDRMKQFADTRTETQKLSDATAALAGTAWQPWIDKAKEYGAIVESFSGKVGGNIGSGNLGSAGANIVSSPNSPVVVIQGNSFFGVQDIQNMVNQIISAWDRR